MGWYYKLSVGDLYRQVKEANDCTYANINSLFIYQLLLYLQLEKSLLLIVKSGPKKISPLI